MRRAVSKAEDGQRGAGPCDRGLQLLISPIDLRRRSRSPEWVIDQHPSGLAESYSPTSLVQRRLGRTLQVNTNLPRRISSEQKEDEPAVVRVTSSTRPRSEPPVARSGPGQGSSGGEAPYSQGRFGRAESGQVNGRRLNTKA